MAKSPRLANSFRLALPQINTRLGLRREAQRHAAFARAEGLFMEQPTRARKSAVAAGALPAQSKTTVEAGSTHAPTAI
jgi:hypothetical protein